MKWFYNLIIFLAYLVRLGFSEKASCNYSMMEEFLNQKRVEEMEEHFSHFYSAIVQAVHQIKWNVHANGERKSFSIAILSQQNCDLDEITAKLLVTLKNIRKVNIKCHQIFISLQTDDIEFLRFPHQATILLLPWYTTEILLERLALYGIDGSHYITVGVSQPYIRWIKKIDTYMKISNILETVVHQDDCRTLDAFASNNSQPRKNVWICTSIESKTLKVVTLLYKGLHIFHLPGSIPGPDMLNECPPGSLPCRKLDEKNKKRSWVWFCCRGQFIDLLDLILKELSTAYDIYFVEDNQFGILLNGTWNGIINDVLQKKADLGLHILNVVKQRLGVVDFTSPIRDHPESFGVLIKRLKPTYLILNWSFLRILQPELLIACFLITLLVTLFVIATERALLGKSKGKRYPTREGMSAITGILLQRDLGAIVSHTWSGQAISLFFALGMTVFIASYTANLIADNIDKEENVFKGLEDEKFKDPEYRVGLTKGTASDMYYNRLPNMFAKKIYFEGSPFQALVDGVIDAFVCSSDFNQEYLDSSSEFVNKLQMYRDDRYQMEYAFAIQKNSVVGKKISDIILMLGYQGKLKMIFDKWVKKKPNVRENTRFPFEYAGGYILVIGATIGLCVVILLLENLYTFVKGKKQGMYNMNESYSSLNL